MDAEARKAISAELSGTERLLWAGMPKQGLRLRLSDLIAIPFSLMWGGFAIYWEFTALSSGLPLFFQLWGLPFVFAGIYLIVGRFFVDSFQRSRTYYGLSDRNAIIVRMGFSKQVQLLSLRTLPEVTLRERADGSGTIAIGVSGQVSSRWSNNSWPGMHGPPMFEMIESARSVYHQIREAQRVAA